MVFHTYGPERYIGSVHIEVPSILNMESLDKLERKITRKDYDKYGVYLSGIGIYSVEQENHEIISISENINNIISEYKSVLQMHGFVANPEIKSIRFDLILEFVEDSDNIVEEIKCDILNLYPNYEIYIQKDLNIDI